MDSEHKIRTLTIAGTFAVTVAAYVGLSALDESHAMLARLEGTIAVLAPALFDALRVARKR